MRAARGSEAVRETKKVLFVDGVQHLDDGAMDDLIFQRGNTERPLPPVRLRDVGPPNRACSERAPLHPGGQVVEMMLQRLAVVPPRFPIDTRPARSPVNASPSRLPAPTHDSGLLWV